MEQQVIQGLIGAGPLGIFVLFFIWDRQKDRELSKLKAEADIALAKALMALTYRITGKGE